MELLFEGEDDEEEDEDEDDSTQKYSSSNNDKLQAVEVTEADDMTYNIIQLYLSRHLCTNAACSGILTPVIGFQEQIPGKDIYECNVCYHKRTHQDFLDSLKDDDN